MLLLLGFLAIVTVVLTRANSGEDMRESLQFRIVPGAIIAQIVALSMMATAKRSQGQEHASTTSAWPALSSAFALLGFGVLLWSGLFEKHLGDWRMIIVISAIAFAAGVLLATAMTMTGRGRAPLAAIGVALVFLLILIH